ncbi:MAG: methyltransferase domain-containing protein [Pseudomonadota bacterium]
MNQHINAPELRQRGRASVDFLVQMLKSSGPIFAEVNSTIAAKLPDPSVLPDDIEERHEAMEELLSGSDAFATQKLLGDWHGRMHGKVAAEAFDEIANDLVPAMEATSKGPATLELDPDIEFPDYYDGVNFHRTSGGWTENANQGFIHGEIIHRKMIGVTFPGGIFQQRQNVAAMAPRDDYANILDMGCSSGHFTFALAKTYPDAQITGIDYAAEMMEHAWRTANANGWNWKLYQRGAEATGFDDASFDLVTSYIVLHEMPEHAIRDMFAEAFRVLEPGGDLLMSDVTRYKDLDKLSVWKADRGAKFGGEPHWRESAQLDFAEIAREAGFVDVKAEGQYPHVVQGRKPA